MGFRKWDAGKVINCIFRAKVELLIRNGANPLVRNDACETPAHNAAIAGNLETLKLLVDKGLSPYKIKISG